MGLLLFFKDRRKTSVTRSVSALSRQRIKKIGGVKMKVKTSDLIYIHNLKLICENCVKNNTLECSNDYTNYFCYIRKSGQDCPDNKEVKK